MKFTLVNKPAVFLQTALATAWLMNLNKNHHEYFDNFFLPKIITRSSE